MPRPHHPKHKDNKCCHYPLLRLKLMCKSLSFSLSIYKQKHWHVCIHMHRCMYVGTLHIIYIGDIICLKLGLYRQAIFACCMAQLSYFTVLSWIYQNNICLNQQQKTIRTFSHTFEHFIWLQPSFFWIGDLQLGHCLELVTSHRQLAAISVSSSVPFTEKQYRHWIIQQRNTR